MSFAGNLVREHIYARDGNAAVEFALVMPATVLLFVGIVVFSIALNMYSSLQEIASQAARAALAGQTATQQSQFASQYVSGVLANYSFIDPTKLTVATTSTTTTLQVSLSYNASNSFFNTFNGSIISGPFIITRSATVQLSGF